LILAPRRFIAGRSAITARVWPAWKTILIAPAIFLDALEKKMPFLVKAIQVDGGAEFEAIFEEECQKQGAEDRIDLFTLQV